MILLRILPDRELTSYVENKLGAFSKKAPLVIKRAVNNTAKETAKRVVKQGKKVYTATKDIGNASDFQITKASTSTLQAILKSNGQGVSVRHFSHRVGKRGISAIINREHGRKKLFKYGNSAFSASGLGSAANGSPIMVRQSGRYMTKQNLTKRNLTHHTKHTEYIANFESISRPVMLGNDNTYGKIEDELHELLMQNVEKEIEKELNKH